MINIKNTLLKKTGIIPVIALSVALGASLANNISSHSPVYAGDQKAAVAENRAALHGLEDAFASIVDGVGPSVVKITSEMKPTAAARTNRLPGGGEDFFKGFPFPFAAPETPDTNEPAPQATGTGVIVRSDGYVLTNDHVVGGADVVTVKLKDGREFKGKVIRDQKSDLALVKIDATGLPAAKLGESRKVRVGSWAIAIGSPFGLDQTVTVGVVSAVKRQEAIENKFYPDLIQTDASINPGNSGGPLVNIDGEVIGVNTLIRASMGGGNIGIGFAIPVDTAKFVMNQLIDHGKVTRGYLGIVPIDLNPNDAASYGVAHGALVQTVSSGGPADKAGILPDDVIIELDGRQITDALQLRNVLESTIPGTTIKVVVVRNKVEKTYNVKIEQFKEREVAEQTAPTINKFGFSVDDLSSDIISDLKLPKDIKGVIITEVDPRSKAAKAGLRGGMVITHANWTITASVADFENVVKSLKSGDILRLRIRSTDGTSVIKIPID